MADGQQLAAVLHGDSRIQLEQRSVPELQENEVLLRMGSVGICGSDLKYWKYSKCGRFTMTTPMIGGHEGSGTVVKCGSKVESLKLGDKVAIEPGVPCRCCPICHSGRYNLCRDMKFCATPPVHGNLCQYFAHPQDFCFKLPESMTLDQGALIEPLAVAVYACERGSIGPGSNLLICGAGPVGLLVLLVSKAIGADRVVITDISESRLALAQELGADYTVDMRSQTDGMEACGEYIKSLTSVDATIECSGADSSVHLGVHSTRPGGSVVLVGRGSMEPTVPLVKAATFEIDIKGVFRYVNCYPKAISLIASGKISPEKLISHQFSLSDSQEAFECASDPSRSAVKVLIRC